MSSFPTVAYHRDTFRLAAADQNAIRLYDLRGSASVRAFEGHTQSVTALSFSRDGRFLLSYSWGEATLRWWQVPSGLIGFLGGAVRPWHTEVVNPALTTTLQQQMKEDEKIEMITFNWIATDVQIAVSGTVVAVVKIPTN
jgi:WD40 repeat protein